MKNTFLTFLMFSGVTAFAQGFISPNLPTALKNNPFNVQDSLALPSPDLSFYSTNYFRIFGYEQYTFDTMAFKNREVFVSSDNRFYRNGTQNMAGALPTDGVMNYYDYQPDGGSAVVGAAMLGIGTFALIGNFINGSKDYSPKVDKAAFEAAGRGE
ncbi:MAG: hypothetical protein ACO1N9_02570 [Flavobacterium sp.]